MGRDPGRERLRRWQIGKWHLSDANLKRSFKQSGPVSGGMFESGPAAYGRPAPGNLWTPWDTSLKGQWLDTSVWQKSAPPGIRHSAQIWAEHTIDALKHPTSDPRFLYVGFNSPHDPRQAPKEFLDRYPKEHVRVPPNYLPQHPFDQGDARVRDELLAPFPRTREAVQLHRSEYLAHITYMDAQIGRVLDALRQSPEADRTYVIFTADHGLAVGQHGLMGKQNLYDHPGLTTTPIAGSSCCKLKPPNMATHYWRAGGRRQMPHHDLLRKHLTRPTPEIRSKIGFTAAARPENMSYTSTYRPPIWTAASSRPAAKDALYRSVFKNLKSATPNVMKITARALATA